MDCKTARLVWNHPHGLIGGLRQHLPGAFEHIESSVKAFVAGETTAWGEVVKNKAGPIKATYRVSHTDGTSEVSRLVHDVLGDITAKKFLENFFTAKHGRPIFLGAICCDGDHVSDKEIPLEDLLKIQLAAVNTDPF